MESVDRQPLPWEQHPDVASIAVLPFADMSPNKDQEYFADGLSEELLNVLAKIRGLRVAARTSSFQFKGKQEDIRVIGEKLNVTTLLEGSVRKSGNQVRITAQLVNVADGFHRDLRSHAGRHLRRAGRHRALVGGCA
jgi:TolB-like protein